MTNYGDAVNIKGRFSTYDNTLNKFEFKSKKTKIQYLNSEKNVH